MISAADIHARVSWPDVLAQLGIPEGVLRNKHGPCPACGGKDRFRFDNKRGRGDFYCNHCGAGDGFKLLERVHGWRFSEARKRVVEAAGLGRDDIGNQRQRPADIGHLSTLPPDAAAEPPERVRRLRRDLCRLENCDDAVDYLASRALWPPPEGCLLKAHSTVEYWDGPKRIGCYSALVADVVDVAGDLVTVHVTYLAAGQKLSDFEPRKILSRMTGRTGCAVRLMAAGETLGIAEGIETALSAAQIDSVPVWAALNATLLSKFEPPPGVLRLRVFADRDEAGLTAALRLLERLQGRICVEIRIPPAPAKDWNDVLTSKRITE